jgi:SAM-dependent methyltransferase
MSTPPAYVLGSETHEIARLDGQAASIAPATEVLLRASGIGPGMRVLDLGTGLGHVAFAVADLVGAEGAVYGVDRSAALLGIAEQRRRVAGLAHVAFAEADVRAFGAAEPFDALVARLLFFHLPDAVDVLRRQLENLVPGGLVLAIDFDVGSVRAEPPVARVTAAGELIRAAFRAAHADPVIGTRLALILNEAGVEAVRGFGVQPYIAPGDPVAPRLITGVLRTLAPTILAAGLATEDELGLTTLEAELTREIEAAGAVALLPAVVGAWGRRPGSRAA